MRVRTLLAGAVAVVALLIGVAGPANAAHKDGSCNSGELCLYWSTTSTSFIDFLIGDNDHRNDTFTCCSDRLGWGQTVADNVATAWNRDSDAYAVVASLLTCEGAFDVVEPLETTILGDAVRNNNWSNCWELP
ncbi:hypothetical protein [Kribbella sp. NBC_00889]|uniref:hypothetical protein n=1 Tax=Kribbella sp. NBC_00889 TaxID=2975974 RepID=UPI0038669B42|nr:hypothetical protein OG817_13240 [Kribbella sp. NBC_00889]